MAWLNEHLAIGGVKIGPGSRGGRVALFVAAMVLAGLVFTLFPGIDLWFSGLFWKPPASWPVGQWPVFQAIFHGLPVATRILAVALLVLLALILLYHRNFGVFDRQRVIYLLANLALGPGLLANTILKDHWGRARPSQIDLLGGTRHFTPALIPSDQCASNCSFVSGHGSMAFALISFAFILAPGPWRRRAVWLALGFGVLTGLARIAQGAHFLSDTVFAGFFMVGLAWLLHLWIVERDGLSADWVARAGRGIGNAVGQLTDHGFHPARRTVILHAATWIAFIVSVLWIDQPVAWSFHNDGDLPLRWLDWITRWGLGGRWLVPTGIITIACLIVANAPRMADTRERWIAWAHVPGYLFLCVALSGIVADIVKVLVGRTRPKILFHDAQFTWAPFSGGGLAWHADHWSFPSGHSATVASMAMGLALLWPRHVVAYWMLAGLVIYSRVALTQHYVSDVIAGTWLGVVTSLYLAGVFRRSGRPLADVVAGVAAPTAPVSWRYRLLGVGSP
ncbi:MAG TPA: phosphatase PAP2 family protein [Stellaceae bacterium]|jgi:lipid A 4'-phosphatase|nr:phosphatase PAP2 family protein [Stellaceae bacterium]